VAFVVHLAVVVGIVVEMGVVEVVVAVASVL